MRYHAEESALDAFYQEIEQAHLQPLWEMRGLLTATPMVKSVPYRWRGELLAQLASKSGELVPVDRGGDRRVLSMSNPGLGGAPFISATMWAAVQYLRPGEVAPAHRHSPGALRFVLDGDGVYTLLDGDPVRMNRGDLILTPAEVFHEHHNPTHNSMMWLDVLDLPVVAALDAVFFEQGLSKEANTAIAERSRSESLYGHGAGLVPAGVSAVPHLRPHSPLAVYRWTETDRALDALLDVGDRQVAELRFQDPTRGCDVMPTMRCEMLRMVGGSTLDADQQTGTRICAVLNGRGSVLIADQYFDISPGDVFVVPSWYTRHLSATTTMDIFTTSDAPVLDALGLFRQSKVS